MKHIKIAKNWLMIVRTCPNCKTKGGGYAYNSDSNIAWGWLCYKCGENTPLMINTKKE
jgi:hypothetical protein